MSMPSAGRLQVSEKRTILVVEDDSEIRTIAAMRLEAAGFKTIAAVDGQDGIDKAVEVMPDAIVMDVRMPRKDGLTALGELKARNDTCRIPVVILSASVGDQQRALDAGARFFITKPYQGGDFLATVFASMDGATRA